MNTDWHPELENRLLGRQCEIVRRKADWVANLVGGGSIALPVPWRIIANGRIAFASEDDGQTFGLPAPLDGEIVAKRLLGGHSITKILVTPDTADLTLHFGRTLRLDAFNNSSGYEGWRIVLPSDDGSISVVALGGGDVAVFQ